MSGIGRRGGISPSLAGVIAGALMVVVVLVMAKINLDFAAPWAHTHTLTVETTDADGISVSSDVRINGRLVGQVTGVRAAGRNAEVTIHVDDSEWPLPATTTASVRLATLLGQKYIELQTTPGSAAAKGAVGGDLADDATIRDARPVVDFDQILDGFDRPTRDALIGAVTSLSGGVSGQEGTIQQLLPDLGDLSRHSTTPTGELAARDDSINRILVNLGIAADQLDRSRDDLAGFIDGLNRVTGALATHQDALRGFIRSGDQLNQTTDEILGNGFAGRLAGGLERLSTTVRDLDRTFRIVYPQTYSFAHAPIADFGGRTAAQAGHDLIYEISDANSQSNKDGYFLREFLQTIDSSGLGAGSSVGSASPPGAGSSSAGNGAPGLPLPRLPVPPPSPGPPLPGIGGSVPTPAPPPATSCPTIICLGSDSWTAAGGDGMLALWGGA